MVGLNQGLLAVLPFSLPQALGVYGFTALIAVLSFGGGGFLIGYFSAGTTIKEAALACTIAALFNAGITLWQSPDTLTAVGTAIAMGVGYAFGFAGGWLGERIQGDTTDKMRERGELPPHAP